MNRSQRILWEMARLRMPSWLVFFLVLWKLSAGYACEFKPAVRFSLQGHEESSNVTGIAELIPQQIGVSIIHGRFVVQENYPRHMYGLISGHHITTRSAEASSSFNVLVSFGGCFLVSWLLLCPCVQRKKKSSFKELSFRGDATSTSTSISLPGSSASGSFSGGPRTQSPSPRKLLPSIQGGQLFTLSDLSKATRKFSPACKVGQGGFGAVYKGKLPDGTLVAIKRAKKKLYDSRISNEFETEVQTLLTIDHLNLVKMIGYLDQNDERILVVEYVPNGNLREHLDGAYGVVLDLGMRLDICIDVAHALTYLHMYAGNPIIHRDVKPTNILLTEKFRAKVADFGYSRMGPLEMEETHVSTEIKGTAGYLDPEYLKKFQLTEKSDVYSFGIVLLEIITGRKPIDEKREMKERVTVKWAFRKFLDGKVVEILDPRLEKSDAACVVVERIAELAFQCAAPTKQDRPCMKNVAEVLWDIRKNYQSFGHLEKRPPSLAVMERSSMPASGNFLTSQVLTWMFSVMACWMPTKLKIIVIASLMEIMQLQ